MMTFNIKYVGGWLYYFSFIWFIYFLYNPPPPTFLWHLVTFFSIKIQGIKTMTIWGQSISQLTQMVTQMIVIMSRQSSEISIWETNTSNKNQTWQKCYFDEPLKEFLMFVEWKPTTTVIARQAGLYGILIHSLLRRNTKRSSFKWVIMISFFFKLFAW